MALVIEDAEIGRGQILIRVRDDDYSSVAYHVALDYEYYPGDKTAWVSGSDWGEHEVIDLEVSRTPTEEELCYIVRCYFASTDPRPQGKPTNVFLSTRLRQTFGAGCPWRESPLSGRLVAYPLYQHGRDN